MKDPQRLLEHGASESELALLRAGVTEEPSAAARQRLLASLGVSGALGSAALAQAGAAQSGAPGAAAGAGGSALKLVSAKLGVKGLALVLGGATLVGGAWVGVMLPSLRAAERAVQEAEREPARTRATVPEARSGALPAPRFEARSATQPAPQRTADGAAQPAPQPNAAALSPAAASLAGEIAQLDRARGLLRAGDARAAAREIDRYAAEHPAGALRQEADVLRIDTLWQLGERSQARRLSRAFLRAHAASPHTERVRTRLQAAGDSGR
jgi:hypothetical protein